MDDVQEMLAGQSPDNVEAKDNVKIGQAIADYDRVEAEIAEFEEKLKQLQEQKQYIVMETIPNIMKEVGVESAKLGDGRKITVAETVSVRLPSTTQIGKAKTKDEALELMQRKDTGLDWLRNHGGGSIIKNELTVNIGKSQDNLASQVKSLCDDLGLSYTEDETVHPSSLRAFLTESLNNGEDVPVDAFALHTATMAKITKR